MLNNEIQRLQQRVAELETALSRKQNVYEKLQESESRYRMLVEFLPIGIILHNGKEILYANQWAMGLIGAFSEDQVIGHPLKEFVHPDTWELAVPRIKQLMLERKGVGLFHEKFVKVDGTPFHVDVGAIPVTYNGQDAVLVSVRDTNEQVKIHNELEAQRDLAQQYLDIAGVIMLALDREGCITMINKRGCEVLGYPHDELIGKDWFQVFLPPDKRKKGKAAFLRLMKDEARPLSCYENNIISGSGEVKTIAWHITVLRDAHGKIYSSLSSGEDITQRKRAEEELLQQKERLSVTLSSIGDGVIATDADGNITLLNGVAQEMTGWSDADAIGRPLPEVFRIVNETTRTPMENPVEKVLKLGIVVGLANGTMLISKDGSEYIIADSGAPIKDGHGNIVGVVMVFRDVTQKKHWDEERQRLQRFETLELMAGGIAHDFNNILTGVLGHLSLFMYSLPDNFSGIVHVEDAQQSVLAARRLVGQLSLMSKGGAPVRVTASVKEVIRASSEISVTGSSCRLVTNISDDLWNVVCDINQISQVFQNIAINAVQAMPAGGTITVEAINQKVSRKDDLPLPSGKYIRVSVKDEGIGIPTEYLDRLFDPYFTTKQNGSGLGLSIVYSIVNRHGGHVDISSGHGSGSVVTVWLPASVDKPAGSVVDAAVDGDYGGRVLVVDDEAVVRDVCTKMLQHLGYEAVATADSTSAIKMLKESLEKGNPFNMAILDLTMPGDVGGKILCGRLRDVSPELVIVASSGYPDDPAMVNPKKFDFAGTLKKPYTVQELKYSLSRVK